MKNSNNPYSRAFRANITPLGDNNSGTGFWDHAPASLRTTALKAADYMEYTTLLADKLTLCHMVYDLSEEKFRNWLRLLNLAEKQLPLEQKHSEAICRRALKTYGAAAQIRMTFEEMAELQKELCKNSRGDENIPHIAEEIADCLIMLEQMQILFCCKAQVDDFIAAKLKRLEQRMDKEIN